MEEVDSDEDSDTQGAGLVPKQSTRFPSDPLRFTGIDMGENMAYQRKKYTHEVSGDEDSSGDSDQETDVDEEGNPQFSTHREDELVESAMRRINKAQATGKKDVRLTRNELAALENRRKRMQAAGEGKKRKKEQRYAVPLSQFAPVSQNEHRSSRVPTAIPSTETLGGPVGQPPVGWFAHPSSSRLGASDSRRRLSRASASDREVRSTSPFQYNYIQQPGHPSSPRHISDSPVVPLSPRGHAFYEEPRIPHYHSSSSLHSVPAALDPFRYMTSGAPAPYHSGSAPSLRNVSGSSAGQTRPSSAFRGTDSAIRREARQITPEDEESSSGEEDSGDDTSEELDQGVQIGSSNHGVPTNGREQIIVEVEREPTPEPRMTRSKKVASSSASSPKPSPKASPKRRSGASSRRKKGSK